MDSNKEKVLENLKNSFLIKVPTDYKSLRIFIIMMYSYLILKDEKIDPEFDRVVQVLAERHSIQAPPLISDKWISHIQHPRVKISKEVFIKELISIFTTHNRSIASIPFLYRELQKKQEYKIDSKSFRYRILNLCRDSFLGFSIQEKGLKGKPYQIQFIPIEEKGGD